MVGGRPVQNLAVDLHADAKAELKAGLTAWTIDRLDFRAHGATQVGFNAANARSNPSGGFAGALSVESSDPDMLAAWLQGRNEITYRNQKPLRLNGDVSIAPDRIAIDAMKAEIDGGAVEGRIAVSGLSASAGSRLEAELKAEHLDLDAAAAFARALAGPQAEWPGEAQLSLDMNRRLLSRQQLRPATPELGHGRTTL